MLILFEKRASAKTIDPRNQLVANLADDLYIPFAAPGSNLSALERKYQT